MIACDGMDGVLDEQFDATIGVTRAIDYIASAQDRVDAVIAEEI